jgi:hypothetical protein
MGILRALLLTTLLNHLALQRLQASLSRTQMEALS